MSARALLSIPVQLFRGLVAKSSTVVVGCLTAIVVAGLAGCAGQNKQKKDKKTIRPGDTPYRVTDFAILGNEAFTDRELKSGLATKETASFRPFGGEPKRFNRLEWKRDIDRILTYYRARGYFNARIASEDILRVSGKKAVKLRLRIREGKPAKTRSIEVLGVDHLDEDLPGQLADRGPLDIGKRFTQQDYLDTRGAVLNYLQRRGYAYATIEGRAFVQPKDQAVKVQFVLDPGPKAKFGDIEIRGLDKIPKSAVREVITFEPGEPFSSTQLQSTQQNIYALEVFSLVTVAPKHELDANGRAGGKLSAGSTRRKNKQEQSGSDETKAGAEQTDPTVDREIDRATTEGRASMQTPRADTVGELLGDLQKKAADRANLDPEVPVVIKLKEARMGNIKVGAGFAIESNRQDVHGQLNMSSKNFLGGLRRVEFFNTAGYAWAPGVFVDETVSSNRGFILNSELRFSQPSFFEAKTNLRVTPSFERDVQVGFTFLSPAARIGIDRTFFDHLTLDVGYKVTYYDFNNISPSLIQDTPLGQDFQEKFLLESFDQRITLDYRNNPLNPTRGLIARGIVQEAGNYIVNGMFQFLKVTAGIEGYIPVNLGTSWVLAARARAGSIYNLEAADPSVETESIQRVPTISRYYSGGKGSMRSFGQRQLSLYRATSQGSIVPVGGLSQVELAVEPRIRLVKNLWGVGDFWGAAFVDAASVHRGPLFTKTRANERLDIDSVGVSEAASSLLFGTGIGFWWDTPIGPVRADVAYTLTPPRDARFRQCNDPSVPETGNPDCPKKPIEDDLVQQRLSRFNFLIGIGHSF